MTASLLLISLLAAGAAPALAADLPPRIDAASVVERVERSYRAEGDGFVAADPRYRVRYSQGEGLVIRGGRGARHAVAWRVRTVDARRGTRGLLAETPRVHPQRDGSLAIEHGPLREQLENRPEGIEQSWAFALEPPGRGDLRVRVRLAGSRLATSDDAGHHFVHAAHAGARLHYGRASWVDAHGVRTAIAASAERDTVVLTVPEALLARSSYPAVLDPLLSPEFPITDPVSMPPTADHSGPDAVWGADGLLAVWGENNPGVSARRVEATLVTPDGKPVMVPPLAFESWSSRPRASFDGTNYLVAYKVGTGVSNADAYTRQIAADGQLVGGVANRVSFLGGVSAVAVAWGGLSHLVVWAESANAGITHDVRAARVGSDGVTIDVASLAVGVDPLTAGWPSVACNAVTGSCLVVWMQSTATVNEIRARPVYLKNEPGSMLGELVQIATGTDPEVVFDGTNFAIVYSGAVPGGSGVRLARTDAAGSPLDDSPVSPGGVSDPAIAWDGTRYLVSWRQGSPADVFGVRVSSAGVVLDVSPIAIAVAAQDQHEARITAGGGYFFPVWRDHRSYEGIGDNFGDVYAHRVAPDGSLVEVDPIDLTPHSNEQTRAAIAFDGLNYLVVWEDLRSRGGPDVYAARVTPRGDVLDPAGIPVGAAPDPQRDPDVDFDGSDFLVVWTDEQGSNPTIRGARIDIDGVVVDSVPAVLSGIGTDYPAHPALAWSGSHHLLVWEDFRNKGTTSNMDVYGARIASSLGSLDPLGIAIATELTSGGFQNDEATPDVASRAGDWLVVWRDVGATGFDIAGRVVMATGALAGAAKIPVSTAANGQQAPVLAASDSGYLAAWEDLRGGASSDIYAARLSDAGAVLDAAGLALVTGAWPASAPAVAWDGIQYIAAWRDARSAAAAIYGTPVSTAGAVGQPGGTQLGVGFDEDLPALSSHGSATSLLVSQRLMSDFPFDAVRLHGRFAGDCGDGVLGGGEQCDDANTLDADGCSAICRDEDARTLYGTASGGTARLVINGVIVQVTTVAGQSAADVAAALADSIFAVLALHTQGTGAWATGDRIVVEGVIESATTTDPGLSFTPPPPVPSLAPTGRWLVVGALALLGSLALAGRRRLPHGS